MISSFSAAAESERTRSESSSDTITNKPNMTVPNEQSWITRLFNSAASWVGYSTGSSVNVSEKQETSLNLSEVAVNFSVSEVKGSAQHYVEQLKVEADEPTQKAKISDEQTCEGISATLNATITSIGHISNDDCDVVHDVVDVASAVSMEIAFGMEEGEIKVATAQELDDVVKNPPTSLTYFITEKNFATEDTTKEDNDAAIGNMGDAEEVMTEQTQSPAKTVLQHMGVEEEANLPDHIGEPEFPEEEQTEE
ncbi:hypothetical protein QR680_000015 [Steinernema hermaphroditum]|uniref:Uncharacterized protein n=1 Tax=Steinernema hermaphroditum TaxID=289476 RepID=A0AA39GUI4_9BILA|nr:hypothetical protein QR680_000015 [Steinernema hermaphroditum]